MAEEDKVLAQELDKRYNCSKKDKTLLLKSSLSVVSPDWETLDPTPDIQELFIEFNDRFFNGKLAFCFVTWSSSELPVDESHGWAGKCYYDQQFSRAQITLSEPILKRRSRRDLVETLLHEMIHAYLFMTRGIVDGHSQEFVYHMNRINEECGSNITVYHTFHDEVDAAVFDLFNSKPHLSEEVSEDVRKCEIKAPEQDERAQNPSGTDQDDNSSKSGPEFTKVEDKKINIRDPVKNVVRVRFLIFNGRSITKHFRVETRLTEVYSYARSLLPLGVEPSLSAYSSELQLDLMPRDYSLVQAGLENSVTLMLSPKVNNSSVSYLDSIIGNMSGKVICTGILVAIAVLAFHSVDFYFVKLLTSNLFEVVMNFLFEVVMNFIRFINYLITGFGGIYCVCAFILLICVFSSFQVGLPHGRLVWVGRYDHN